MVQEIIVYIIGLAVTVYIIAGVYKFITSAGDACYGCNGCDVKSQLERKQHHCSGSGGGCH